MRYIISVICFIIAFQTEAYSPLSLNIVSPDGKYDVYVHYLSNNFYFYNVLNKNLIKTKKMNIRYKTEPCFVSNNLLAIQTNENIELIDASTGLSKGSIKNTKSIYPPISDIGCDPKNERLIQYFLTDGKVHILDKNLNTISAFPSPEPYLLSLSSNGSILALGADNSFSRTLSIIDLTTGRLVLNTSDYNGPFAGLKLSENGEFFSAYRHGEGLLFVYSLISKKVILQLGTGNRFHDLIPKFAGDKFFVFEQAGTSNIGFSVALSAYSMKDFHKLWAWNTQGWSLTSFDVSSAFGKTLLMTDELNVFDNNSGLTKKIYGGSCSIDQWRFSPTAPILINARPDCGLTILNAN